jgi:hypothetical protein
MKLRCSCTGRELVKKGVAGQMIYTALNLGSVLSMPTNPNFDTYLCTVQCTLYQVHWVIVVEYGRRIFFFNQGELTSEVAIL